MKKQNVDLKMKKDSVQQKQPYGKPVLKAVKLCADQVLNTCVVASFTCTFDQSQNGF